MSAALLLLGGLLLFALVPLNLLRPFIFEFLPQIVAFLGVYFVGCCALGGAGGGAYAGGP